MSRFDWQTEREEWEAAVDPRPENRRRRWWGLLSLALVLTIVGLLGYRHLRQRADATVAHLRNDVAGSFTVVQEMAGDADLLAPFLSGRDPNWAAAQKALRQDDPFIGLRRLGLEPAFAQLDEALSPVATPDITLSPNLQEAAVTAIYAYAVRLGPDRARRVHFTRTDIYRPGEDRWLWSPPSPEWWGRTQRARGERLTLIYPRRDEALVLRLGHELEALVDAVCAAENVDCAALPEVVVRFDPDPEAFLAIADWAGHLDRGLAVRLPAPSLIGEPVSDAAYDALGDGYAALLLEPLLAALSGYQCCTQALFFDAIVRAELDRLGYRPWPLAAADYDRLLRDGASPSAPGRTWFSEPDAALSSDSRPVVLALIDFFRSTEPAPSAVALIAELRDAGGYGRWLNAFSDPLARPMAWRQFLAGAARSARARPLAALPDQWLQLTCRPGGTGQSQVHLYNPARDAWRPAPALPEGRTATNHYPLDEATWLVESVERVDGALVWRLALVRDDALIVVAPPDMAPGTSLYFAGSDPSQRFAAVSEVDVDTNTLNSYVLDLNECRAGDCPLTAVDGLPRWSPSGEQTINLILDLSTMMEGGFQPRLALGNRSGQAAVDLGLEGFPYWLDDATLAVVSSGDAGQEIVVLNTATVDGVPAVLERLSVAALTREVASFEANYRASVVVANPARSDEMLLSIIDARDRFVALLLLNWRRPVGRMIMFTSGPFGSGAFSPDGRWLVTFEAASGQSMSRLVLYDLRGSTPRAVESLAAFSFASEQREAWTADSRWLVVLDEGTATLLAPGSDARFTLHLEEVGCNEATWVPVN